MFSSLNTLRELMPKLPVISGKKLLRLLLRHSQYQQIRQHGSHVIVLDCVQQVQTTIPVHSNRDLPKGTLRAILSDLGLSLERLLSLLH